MLVRLGEEGDISVLVIEQKSGWPRGLQERRNHGQRRVNVIESRACSDRDLQSACRVGRHSQAAPEFDAQVKDDVAARSASHRSRAWPNPRLYFQSDAADSLVAARADRTHRVWRADALGGVLRMPGGRARRDATGSARSSGQPPCSSSARWIQGDELRFIRDIVGGSGLRARLGRRLDRWQALVLRRLRQEIALNSARRARRVSVGSRYLGDRWLRPSQLVRARLTSPA